MLQTKNKLLAFIIVLVLIVSQSSVMAFAVETEAAIAEAPGIVRGNLVYMPGVVPSDLTISIYKGVATIPSGTGMGSVSGLTKIEPEADGSYNLTSVGMYTLQATGTGYYGFQTYFEVTQDQMNMTYYGIDVSMNLPVETNMHAGVRNHDSGQNIRVPSYNDRSYTAKLGITEENAWQTAGNWTTVLYKGPVRPDFTDEDGAPTVIEGFNLADWPGFFALAGPGSATPDWDGVFHTPALDPNRSSSRPLYQWTTQGEMMNMFAELNNNCNYMYTYIAGVTPGEYAEEIPFAVFTTTNLTGMSMEEAGKAVRSNGKLTFFHGASIHGNEQSAGEGALAMLYDMAATPWGREVIEDINVIIYPRINPTGHAASTRAGEAVEDLQLAVDMNRDHMAFKAREIRDLHYAWAQFLPHVAIDGHELGAWRTTGSAPNVQDYSSSYTADMQSTPATDLNIDPAVTDWAIKISNKQQADARQSGIRSYHYTGNGTTNNNSIGRAFYGNMNAISILVETRGQAAGLMQRRTYTQYMTAHSIIRTLRENASEIKNTVDTARQKVIDTGDIYDENVLINLETYIPGGTSPSGSGERDWRLGNIQQFNLTVDGKATLGNADGVVGKYHPERTRPRPTAYVVPKVLLDSNGVDRIDKLLYVLDGQGIEYFEVEAGTKAPVQQYFMDPEKAIKSTPESVGYPHLSASNGKGTNTGTFRTWLGEKTEVVFEQGAYVIPVGQVAGTIVTLLMEPDTTSTPGYAGSFVQGVVNAGNNPILGGYQADIYFDRPDGSFPFYRFIENDPRGFFDEVNLAFESNSVRNSEGYDLNVKSGFDKKVEANTAVLEYTFDTSKFEFDSFEAATNVSIIGGEEAIELTETGVKLIVMAPNWDMEDFGTLNLKVKEKLDLEASYKVLLKATYVVRDAEEPLGKKILVLEGEENITVIPGKQPPYSLVDLSDIIDYFGVTPEDAEWDVAYEWDLNSDGIIDLLDIVTVAKGIE